MSYLQTEVLFVFEDNISNFDKVIVYEEECYNLPINIIDFIVFPNHKIIFVWIFNFK